MEFKTNTSANAATSYTGIIQKAINTNSLTNLLSMFLFHSNSLLDKPKDPIQEENKRLDARVADSNKV
jgi:hypothetical protein